MSKMSKRWKAVERIFAEFLGSERTPLSGGNSKITRSDSMHPRIFLECKHRATDATASLYDKTVVLAEKEGKLPVVGLHRKGSDKYLIVVEIRDLQDLAREIAQHGRKHKRKRKQLGQKVSRRFQEI